MPLPAAASVMRTAGLLSKWFCISLVFMLLSCHPLADSALAKCAIDVAKGDKMSFSGDGMARSDSDMTPQVLHFGIVEAGEE